jgi:rubrerythrin
MQLFFDAPAVGPVDAARVVTAICQRRAQPAGTCGAAQTMRFKIRICSLAIDAANIADRERQFDMARRWGTVAQESVQYRFPNFFNRKESVVNLKGSKTEKNLKDAFAGESQANRRYLYFAAKADVEGFNDVSAVFRSTAEGETGHAHGHLEYLEAVGDPATGLPIGATSLNLKAAIAGETHEYSDMYPGMAKSAREEGFGEIADWFETLAKAERSHANRFQKALDNL